MQEGLIHSSEIEIEKLEIIVLSYFYTKLHYILIASGLHY